MSWRREFVINKLSELLDIQKNNLKIINIEKGIFNDSIRYCKENSYPLKWSDINFCKYYSSKSRKIIANLSYTPNSNNFKEKVLNDTFEPYDLVKLTHEEMDPERWAKIKINVLKKYINTDKKEQPDGMFRCNACKSKKTIYYQMQTRSADEPMTTFVTCTNCNKHWKC